MGPAKRYFWEEPYNAAILETDNAKLRERIVAATTAIGARLEELRMDGQGTPEEQKAISDALIGLKTLERERLG